MKASDFIVHLQQMIEEHGDLPLALLEGVVRINDEDEFFNEDDEKVKVDKVFLID